MSRASDLATISEFTPEELAFMSEMKEGYIISSLTDQFNRRELAWLRFQRWLAQCGLDGEWTSN